MANWKSGLGGAASGAAAGSVFGPWGTAIGGGLGALIGLFGPDDSEAEEAARKREQIYKDLYSQYLGPDSDSQKALDRLEKLSETGLTAEDRASAYNLLDQSDTAARGRDEALREEQAATGRGASSSGLDATLRAQASQAAAQRQTQGEVNIAGVAAQRRAAALEAYLAQKQRNDQLLMQWKLATTGGQADALKGVQDLAERQNYADTQNLYHGLDSLTTTGLYLKKYGDQKQLTAGAPPAPGVSTPPTGASPAQMTRAPLPSFDSPTAMTANDAAQQYAGGPMATMKPRHMDQFGMYDLSPLLDDQYKQ